MREWISKLFAVGRHGRRDEELDDELRFHLDELTRGLELRGLDAAAARAVAERELGGTNRIKQAWRDERSWQPLEELLQDVRYALRVLRRSKGLSLTSALMLAAAVAATTSLFSVVDAVLLAPLPYPRANQLVVIFEEYLPQHARNVSVAPGNFLEWQDRARSIAAMTAIENRQQSLTSDGEPQEITVAAVSQGFRPTVGVQPVTGRLFATEEFQPGRDAVVVLGHALWMSRYGGAPVVGRTIVLDDRSYSIIGVMPAGFIFPRPDGQAWVPLPMTAADRENRSGHSLLTVARIREGVSVTSAARELHSIAELLRRDYPSSNRNFDVAVVSAREALVGRTAAVLQVIIGAVALLVLVACANVAGLLLTHGVSRNRELAVRSALGATRIRIARQLLTESLVLASVGALTGIAIAWAGQPLVEALRPADFLTWKKVAIDGRAVAFSAGIAMICGTLFGVIPAFLASRANIAAAASERSAGHRASRVRQALVAVEVALAVVLVAGSVLLAQTLAHLTTVDPGFRPGPVVTMTLTLPETRYRDDGRVNAFYRVLFERLRSVAGVRAAGAVHALPLSGDTSVRPYEIEGGPTGDDRPVAHYRIVTPGYLEAMGIRLIAGRTFEDSDNQDRPLAVIVNETLQRLAWGDHGAIGQRMTFGGTPGTARRWGQVVGVIGDVYHFGPDIAPPAEMYWPAAQIDAVPGDTLRRMRRGMTLVVATESSDPQLIVPTVRAAVHAIDPDQPVARIRTMASLMSASLWLSRAATWLMTVFGGAAFTFALLGVFGAASYAVAQRRRELAVRLALGAKPDNVARLVLAGTLAGSAAGIAIGIGLSVALRRTLAALLVGIDSATPLTLAAVALGLAVATALVTWLPARRAASIDPAQALRVE